MAVPLSSSWPERATSDDAGGYYAWHAHPSSACPDRTATPRFVSRRLQQSNHAPGGSRPPAGSRSAHDSQAMPSSSRSPPDQ
jgi:hypothetical protein